MNRTLCCAAGAYLALAAGFHTASFAAASADRDSISATIKAEVRDIVTGINTGNADLAASHDAPNIVVVESSQPNTVGAAADLAGYKQTLAAAPSWRVSLVEEAVDVPASADMAVYRAVYNEDSTHDGVPFTHRTNVIAGWGRQENGTWMMTWLVVSPMEKSHKK